MGGMMKAQNIRNVIDRAILVATGAHEGQVDKQGQPYILHVLRVGLSGETEQEKVTGFLHDLLEDTDYTEEDLRQGLWFEEKVISAIVALTHKKGQSNRDYYLQVKKNPLALKVKMYDIYDNTSRLDGIEDEETRIRLKKKYTHAFDVLFGESKYVES